MANALLLALSKAKGKGAESDDDEAPDSEAGEGKDYKQIAKDALKDGDWDAAVDALCAAMK